MEARYRTNSAPRLPSWIQEARLGQRREYRSRNERVKKRGEGNGSEKSREGNQIWRTSLHTDESMSINGCNCPTSPCEEV